MISKIDEIVDAVKARACNNFKRLKGITDFHLDFKIYGKNGVMAIFPNQEKNVCSDECLL